MGKSDPTFVIARNHHMPDMAVDVMQSLTLELNRSSTLHNAHTNQAIAKEQKWTSIFANGTFDGNGVGLQL